MPGPTLWRELCKRSEFRSPLITRIGKGAPHGQQGFLNFQEPFEKTTSSILIARNPHRVGGGKPLLMIIIKIHMDSRPPIRVDILILGLEEKIVPF